MPSSTDLPNVIPSLADAPWLQRSETQAVLSALRAAGHEGRVVGGAVRNTLLGTLPGAHGRRLITDIDIATPATPEAVMRAAEVAGLHVVATGLQHGTVTVIAGRVPHEVTTLRRDVATDGRHATVAFTADWAADAARRDFTINALYCSADGQVHDPLGGWPDLLARRVRFIGSADQRIAEDYLRILRFFRFHAEYGVGAPDADGLAACVRGRGGLARLSAERIRAELLKLLQAPGALVSLEAMFCHGLLVAVLGAVPRLPALARLMAIEAALGLPADGMVRLGCLALHGAEDAARLSTRLRLSNDEHTVLSGLVAPSGVGVHVALSDAEAKVGLYRVGKTAWERSVLAAWAWSGGAWSGGARSGGARSAGSASWSVDSPAEAPWRTLLSLPDRWPPPVLPIRGRDLLNLGMKPGPRVGVLLRQIEQHWIDRGFIDGMDALRAFAATLMAAQDGRKPS